MANFSFKQRFAFTILGLTNNFSYIVMLSAAEDLINRLSRPTQINDEYLEQKFCNDLSTSTILLADIAPALLLQISYPFLLVDVRPIFKVIVTALLAVIGFILTGLSNDMILVFTGVVSASISSGLGESTFLSDSSIFGIESLAGWAMGTGVAGIFGSTAYAILTIFLPVKTIMLIMTIVPLCMILIYIFIVKGERQKRIEQLGQMKSKRPKLESLSESKSAKRFERRSNIELNNNSFDNDYDDDSSHIEFGLKEKIKYLPKLANYFFPVVIVFFGGYFINQGLVEFIYYDEIRFLDKAAQYRWLQVAYQVGVLISRSSISLFRIKHIWTMALLQIINILIILGHVSQLFLIPSFYLVAFIVLYEGLLTGFSYTNTYYKMNKEVEQSKQHFSISAVVISDAFGISLAALAALPVHDTLCRLYD